MKSFKQLLIVMAVAGILAGCDVNDPIYETSHPEHGKITLTTDWARRTEGIVIPSSYTVKIGDHTTDFSGVTNEHSNLFAPGTYRLNIYHAADKITVNGTTASVATITRATTEVDPMPGWLHTAAMNVTIEKGKEHQITVAMKQEVCQLNIELTVTEGDPARISGITGTLAGVAGAWNFDTDTPVGDAVSVSPAFTQTGSKITAQMRLLGIVPSATQNLTLMMIFFDGSTQTITKDLSGLLSDFNTDQHIAVKITADIQTPIEAGFAATITGWKVKESSSGVAW